MVTLKITKNLFRWRKAIRQYELALKSSRYTSEGKLKLKDLMDRKIRLLYEVLYKSKLDDNVKEIIDGLPKVKAPTNKKPPLNE